MKILISLSAALDKYLAMFKNLPNYKEEESFIKVSIKSFINDYKKEDKIVYMCRALKISILTTYCKSKNLPEDIVDIEMKKYDVSNYWTSRTFAQFADEITHYMSLNTKNISDYTFGKKSREQIQKDLKAIEDKWIASRKGIVSEYGKKFISFNDGSAWFDLEREYCDDEADAMGHCGNRGDPQPGDTILSYRVPVKDAEGVAAWKPLLTFILRKDGYISESKGRGNDKPEEKFHPVIIKLLLDKRIKGIRGGGYRPENNFSVNDLKRSIKIALLKKKPSLASMTDLAKMYKDDKDVNALNIILKMLKKHGIKIDETGKTPFKILIGNYDSVQDFAEENKLPKLKHYSDEENFAFDDYYNNSAFSKDAVIDLLTELRNKNSSAFEIITKRCLEHDEDFDTSDLREIFEYIDDEDDEIKDIFTNAISDGERYGAESEAYRAVQSTLNDCGVAVDDNGKVQVWHDTIYSILAFDGIDDIACNDWLDSGDDLLEFVKRNSNSPESVIEQFDFEDLEEPYYGFNGYDEDGALEVLVNSLYELE